MENIIQTPSTVENVRPLKDGGVSVTIHTNEMSNEDKLVLLNLLGKFGWFLFKPDTEWDTSEIPKEDSGYDDGMSPQKRLRSVIYRYWEQAGQQTTPDFESFYRRHIEKIIGQYKEKLI